MRKTILLLSASFILPVMLAFLPATAFAQSNFDGGTLGDCLQDSQGDKEVFIACIETNQDEIEASLDLGEGWSVRLKDFVHQNGNWFSSLRFIIDRIEDRLDRREDVIDRAEDRRDRREDFLDRGEDLWDRWEDRHDDELDLEDIFDRREDFRDRREDRRDRKEDRRDRFENLKDHLEQRRDRRWP